MSNNFSKIVAVATIVGGVLAGAVSASAALNLPTQSCAFVFNTNMKLGSRGADVMNLQKVLNGYSQTKVDGTGLGSSGKETTYFGPATRSAVNRFQALHLAELGISAPTGNVFAGTRGLLNQVCSGVTTPNVPGTTPTTPGTTPTTQSGPVSVSMSASQPQQMIAVGQSGALLANLTFTGNGSVTNLQLQRTGVSADAVLSNVYLYDGNTRITDSASVITGGYINFNTPQGLFTVNGSRTISVRADVANVSSYAGNSVGVKVNSFTTQGGSATTVANVQGNQLVLAYVATLSTVNFAALVNSAASVNAGTTNYNVWSGSATVSNRAVNLKAATFKFVGSAPADALANVGLYIDGTKVASSNGIDTANNSKVTFDLGATPFVLNTGSHTVDVRADIVKGSYRTITMSVENVSDLMLEDSSLAGVNVSAQIASSAFTQSAATYSQITVAKGTVTANVDPTFSASQVTGGATNVPVGQFILKAYGEDVKVNTLKVTFATTTITTLNNVSLYVNGGQVGTSQNFLGTTALTYTLGSSLILPANTAVTLTVKADMVNASSAAYTTGTVATIVGGVSSNAQGQSSYEAVDAAATAVTGNTLTVSSGAGSFARTSGFTSITVSPNSQNVKIGSFSIQANSSESLKVNSIGVNPIVTGNTNAISNYSNLTVKTGSTVLGTPVGSVSSGTTTFSFNDITVPANGTQTFDVYADIGSAASSTSNPVVTAAMSVTYRGSVSNTTSVASAAGPTGGVISATASFSVPTLVSSSNTAQYVVGGSTFEIAKFKLSTATAGTSAVVNELRFITAGTDAIESITVGGQTKNVAGSGAAATTTFTGLSIAVDANGYTLPVMVKFSGFQGTTNAGNLSASSITTSVTLGYIGGTSGSALTPQITGIASSNMVLMSSKPVVTVGAGNTSVLILGTQNKVGEFTVTADANGKVFVASTSLSLSTVGIDSPEFTSLTVKDSSNVTITGSTVTGSSTAVATFATPYEIPAGTSKTFSLWAAVGGTNTASVSQHYVVSQLTSAATFKWIDSLIGSSVVTGGSLVDFPLTSSYTTLR